MDVSTIKVLNRTLSNTATHVESDQSGVITEQWGDVSISYNAYAKYDEVEIPVQSEVDKKLYEKRENARRTHIRLDPSINDELDAIKQYYIENHLGPYKFPFKGYAITKDYEPEPGPIPEPTPQEKYIEIIQKLGDSKNYYPVIIEGIVSSEYGGETKNCTTYVDSDINLTSLVSTTSNNTGDWGSYCAVVKNPYENNNNISKYIIICAKLKPGTTTTLNDGLLTVVIDQWPNNMINNPNFKRFNNFVELNDTEYKWFIISTNTSSNTWIRTGISSVNQNILIPYMIYTNQEIELY